ncbi:VOC family protein [Paeniglutamicibacter sp. NPDC012692]|uniref:VOC family protein n=1 Tax=Paeniglutamicibacter sp. NPDC012692 TaxID=3364388 RepID=UPI0036B484D4
MSAHELDHLAIAVRSWAPAGELLNRELGARWASGFAMPVFSPCQLALADDMRIELLEPGTAADSFIGRFLDENDGNAAPHHITFKVEDIHAAIAGAQQAGIEPILVNLEHPEWQEAFLHPRDTGLGFLAQMVRAPRSIEELTSQDDQWSTPCPWEQLAGEPVQLRVIHGHVENLERARTVLVQVLGAEEFPVAGNGAGFTWNEGADLVLHEVPAGTKGTGLRAIGVAEPRGIREPGAYPPDIREVLESGVLHPELGLRISPLKANALAADA